MTKQTPLVGKAAMAWWARVSHSRTHDEYAIRKACREVLGAKPQKIRPWRNRKGWYKVVMDEEIRLEVSVHSSQCVIRGVCLYLADYYPRVITQIGSLEDLGRMLARRGPAPGRIRRALPYILVGVLVIGMLGVVYGAAFAFWPEVAK